jgi:flagellar secretion chaperone FliS
MLEQSRTMFDPTATYRTSQVMTASPLDQIVLLYQAAIRHALLHLTALERADNETAHRASIKCQEVVSTLQESLDLSTGPIAAQLDQLYTFVLERLVAGNVRKDPQPTREALQVLRDLLPAWQGIATQPGPGHAAATAPSADGRRAIAPAVL